jgi:hypothetical protein
MKLFLALVLCGSVLLSGCAFFGYYKHPKAEWAPPEEAATVKFPNALGNGIQLTGPMLAALKVAMDEYRPPSIKPEALMNLEEQCLARWENIRARVIQSNENLFYVQLLPDLRGCTPNYRVLDSGAVYAIDGKGRILAKEQ